MNPIADQINFADRVIFLTKENKAIWLKDEYNTDVGHCFIDDELFIFTLHRKGEEQNPDMTDMVTCYARNIGIFWPKSLPQYETLRDLIEKALPNKNDCATKKLQCAKTQLKKLANIGASQ